MARALAPDARPEWVSQQDFERWQARRRWARAGIMYTVMLFFAVIFLGPLLFATVSSVKTDPLEYPPTLAVQQLSPRNWAAAARLGVAGAGDRWWGGFAPGANVPFEVTYFVSAGREPEVPEVDVPRRRPGAGLGARQVIDYAADYATITEIQETSREEGSYSIGGQEVSGQ
ncbi:MAG: carbohydrate ABC transporter permease, partial [Deinococcota bacterium]|nr:carbohydrate ABC transporter permease [Deinococcota bacterium]